MLLEGRVFGSGSTGIADQTPVLGRFTKHNALAIADVASHFYEYAIRGKLFYGNSSSAGTSPVATIGTTAMFTLFNPKGATVNLAVLWGSVSYLSGTLPSGFISWCTNSNLSEAVPTGTAVTSKPALIGGVTSQGVCLETATLFSSPTMTRNLASITPILATTANNPFQIYDLVDGAIVLPPGGAVSLQGVLTATTGKLIFNVAWAEEPI